MPEWDSRHQSSLTHGGAQSVSVPRTWWGTAQIHAYGPPPRTRLRGKEWQSGILAFASNPSRILARASNRCPSHPLGSREDPETRRIPALPAGKRPLSGPSSRAGKGRQWR